MKNGITLITSENARRLRAQVSIAQVLDTGEVARWWCKHVADCMPTTVIQSGRAPAVLPEDHLEALLDVRAETPDGAYSLGDVLAEPAFGVRGVVVVKGGRIATESYLGMRPEEAHWLASCAKPAAGLMIEQLIDAGLVDDRRTVGHYSEAFGGSDWAAVPVRDVLDMVSGMDLAETAEAFADQRSATYRLLLAEFGEPSDGRVESVLDVLRSGHSLRPPGEVFEYGSGGTQVLVQLAEEVSGLPWCDLFRDGVWAHLGADGPLLVHLSPGGDALAHGIVSSRLRDLARFGMLYTPSWSKVSDRQSVSAETLARIRGGVRGKSFFTNSQDAESYIERLGDDTMLGNARHWDCVWPDGDMFKSGFMGQGLYVSPGKDVVIAYFSSSSTAPMVRFLRPLIRSGLLD